MTKQFPYKFISKKGTSVVFRYLQEDDLDPMLVYINTLIAEDTFIGLYGEPLTREEEKKHLDETIEKMSKGDKIVIVVEINNRYVGSGDLTRETIRRKKHGGGYRNIIIKGIPRGRDRSRTSDDSYRRREKTRIKTSPFDVS